jgi:hypothetical protein
MAAFQEKIIHLALDWGHQFVCLWHCFRAGRFRRLVEQVLDLSVSHIAAITARGHRRRHTADWLTEVECGPFADRPLGIPRTPAP